MRWIACSLAALAVIVAGAVARADETTIDVGVRGSMHATLITPDGPGPFPGVIVLHTSGGLQTADLAYARALADEGYVCLVPAFMAAYGLDANSRQATFTNDAQSIYADLVQAVGALKRNPHVQGAKIGAVGFSNGGYFAVWLALAGAVQAGVGYYGAYSGANTDASETRFRQTANASSSPVLILHGAADATVPVGLARRLAKILEDANAPVEIHVYPDTGHLFDRGGFSPTAAFGKNAKLSDLAGADPGDDAADSDAWSQTLAFFAAHLR
jgi:carboxymethylenebutenolidase